MTDRQELRFVLLLALIQLGGRATKRDVLNHVHDNGYLFLRAEDLVLVATGEERWRNDLAWVRDHLVKERFLSRAERGYWITTATAQEYFEELLELALRSHPARITDVAINQAQAMPDNHQVT
jgi:hypothetical protein